MVPRLCEVWTRCSRGERVPLVDCGTCRFGLPIKSGFPGIFDSAHIPGLIACVVSFAFVGLLLSTLVVKTAGSSLKTSTVVGVLCTIPSALVGFATFPIFYIYSDSSSAASLCLDPNATFAFEPPEMSMNCVISSARAAVRTFSSDAGSNCIYLAAAVSICLFLFESSIALKKLLSSLHGFEVELGVELRLFFWIGIMCFTSLIVYAVVIQLASLVDTMGVGTLSVIFSDQLMYVSPLL